MKKAPFYYFFCNHWTQGGIGFAFPTGWYNGKKYNRTFSTVYTIHKMLDAADKYPGLKVSMELDAYAYEEVEKEDPGCIKRLKKYIKEEKAAVDGGTYGQPFGQDYGWEPNIRQLTYGRKTVKEVLDYDVRAFLVEEQWFHPQMPQILKKSGFEYASLQNQNSGQVKPLNKSMILWKGIDGIKIPSIPANDLMVSCVRQYTGYDGYKERLQDYERPLLFQWVEIWPPGMDWGASVEPFEKAINQVEEWGGKPVTLQEYFDLEIEGRNLEEIYIPLDQSNYTNNWYQGGGWGYDGDQVIMWDQKAEQALLAYESFSAVQHIDTQVDNSAEIERLWKHLLILQNHDFSVARSYRAITEEGLTTEAGSYGIAKYKELTSTCLYGIDKFFPEKIGNHLVVSNYNGVMKQKAVPFEIESAESNISLEQDGEDIPFYITDNNGGKISGIMVPKMPALGYSTVTIKNGKGENFSSVQTGEDWIEDENFMIKWRKGSWNIEIYNKNNDQRVDFTGFTGPIGKQNEHGGPFPALSPAHEVFTFAFDGTTHCPDQLSLSRIQAEIESSNSLESTLKLHCDLLTLHTTETPVAFAESRVTINHITNEVKCQSYLYTGVYLSVQAHAVFNHSLNEAEYYRDFPFGEERTEKNEGYANSYVRVQNEQKGFTLVHPGVQRIELQRDHDKGAVKHLLARDKIFGEYEWTFSLHFGKHEPHESARLSKADRALVVVKQTEKPKTNEFLAIEDDRLIMSSFSKQSECYFLRIVNYSNETLQRKTISLPNHFTKFQEVDFEGNLLADVNFTVKDSCTQLVLDFSPWEIVTLKCMV
ncbi:hypothetical protein [Pseudalkalibacillus caeni]|uniref:Glycoside hydrolase family 38 N-terminal domain-containing protein n=1 Tax=Exobacillus caeni TaxID=2574798 RepID=A0A5R9FFQ7_9BACL|nr:hypothetical protein [Pseudalkalibacillus caeni]TLS38395.1 hypothetical protein FCL54_04430 [Pseudalkalibacillus caeni]